MEEVIPLIQSIREKRATHDELVRYVADKLDVPSSYLMTQVTAQTSPAPQARRFEAASRPPDAAPAPRLDAVTRAERAFVAMCVANGGPGREHLARLRDEHLSYAPLRAVRDHLVSNFDEPLAQLPADDPALAAGVNEVVMLADEVPSSETALRMSYLQLELRRVERELRQAGRAEDFERQRQLWPTLNDIKREIDTVMGQTL